MNEKARVTIDTNLVLSGIISPNSTPSHLLTAWIHGAFEWILTDAIFGEIKEVLSRKDITSKYHISESETRGFLENLEVAADFVTPLPLHALPIHCRDAKDDIFLACALGGRCDYLITGDEDLLVLNGEKALGKLQIIKVAAFLHQNQ